MIGTLVVRTFQFGLKTRRQSVESIRDVAVVEEDVQLLDASHDVVRVLLERFEPGRERIIKTQSTPSVVCGL